jgi:P4 family phage/plasmid primase-like protien
MDGNYPAKYPSFKEVNEFLTRDVGRTLQQLFGSRLKSGGDGYVISSPLRDDKNPSFSINSTNGLFHDFGSGQGGDLIKLYALDRNLGNFEALKEICRIFGLENHIPAGTKKPRKEEPETTLFWPPPQYAYEMPLPDTIFHQNQELSVTKYYKYHNRQGVLCGYVARADFDDVNKEGRPFRNKTTRPVTFRRAENESVKGAKGRMEKGEEGWMFKGHPQPRILYNLHLLDLFPDAKIIIVEGEKTTDSLYSHLKEKGWIVLSLNGGTSGAKDNDFTDIEEMIRLGRNVFLWPDNDKDNKGRIAMEKVAAKTGALVMDIPSKFHGTAIEIPKDGWDADDALKITNPVALDIEKFIERCRKYPVGNEFSIASNDNEPPKGSEFEGDGLTPEDELSENLTDQGSAVRLVRLLGHNIRYVIKLESFYIWDGTKWEKQPKNNNVRALRFVRELGKDVKKERNAKFPLGKPDKEEDPSGVKLWEAYTKYEKTTLESNSVQKNIVAQIKPDRRVSAILGDFDRDGFVFAAKNGTLVLGETGFKLVKHQREHYNTRSSETAYDKDAKCPAWLQTLELFLPDPEERAYLQRFAGYCMTGSTKERMFLIAYGTGSNGKSTIFDTLKGVLGEYAMQADRGSFFESRNEDNKSDGLVRIASARLVTSSEPRKDAQLDVALIKQVTGDLTSVGRALFENYGEFETLIKLVISTNHKPKVNDDNKAIWRRIHMLHFGVDIENLNVEVDGDMVRNLRSEYAGILNWMLEGYLEWTKQGLNPPESIVEAVKDYRKEDDSIRGFFEECCESKEGVSVQAGKLFDLYKIWCDENDIDESKRKSSPKFGERMKKGFNLEFKKGRNYSEYLNIAIKGDFWSSVFSRIGFLEVVDSEGNVRLDRQF